MRVLALDHGERRIGVALSDALGIIASPLTTIEHTTDANDADAVTALIGENGVQEVVVGIPISLDGSIGPQAKRAAYFARLLSERTGVPVETVDERLSTREAKRKLGEGGGRRTKDRGRVDAAAAAVLLQAYLDSRPRAGLKGIPTYPTT